MISLRTVILLGMASVGAALPGTRYAFAQTPLASEDFKSNQAVNRPGFINVWKLRRDVAMVEQIEISNDTDHCDREEDPGEKPPNGREIERRERVRRSCVADIRRRHTAYQRAFEAFNKAWQPVMMEAVRKGDIVAEVIMRQCTTTSVLDRREIESTCDENSQRRTIAAKRLRTIGFAPAFDREGEAAAETRPPGSGRISRSEAQKGILELFRQGIFGVDMLSAHHGGNAPRDAADLEDLRRAAIIGAALQEAPRAFTVSSGSYSAGWKTSEFATLRLNRKPLTPGYLTWGRELYYGGGNSPYTGPHYWRSGPIQVYLQFDHNREISVAGKDDHEFLKQLHETLASAEDSIDRYLKQDERWGVFLLHRVGLHEWVPEGTTSESGKLRHEWLGEWKLQKTFKDWKQVESPTPASATVFTDGTSTRVVFRTGTAPQQTCQGRYSGGLTYLPGKAGHATTSTETALGYLPGISHISQFDPGPLAPFEPLDPRKRYRQVLVQCAEGEWFDTDRVRFLLLAGDTLLEVTKEPVRGAPVIVHHYSRESPQASAPGGEARLLLDRLGEDAKRATAAAEHLLKTDIQTLIASLHQTRNESLYYSWNRFPPNLQEIGQRSGNIAELSAAYYADKDDATFRFNIIMILSHKLKTEKLTNGENDAIANCLVNSLKDDSAWVRTEGVWGLRFTGDEKYESAAISMLNDSDGHVRSEARATANLLRGKRR